jgi:ATP-binding cassette, subfamily B, bacterial
MNQGTTSASQQPRWQRARVVYGHFREHLDGRRRRLLAGAGFGVVYALTRAAEPWPLKVVIDQVLFHKPAHGFWLHPFLIFGRSAYDLLAAAGLVLATAGLVRGVSYYYEDYLLSTTAQETVYDIRTRLYRHLHRLPLAFHQRRSTGDLLVRLSTDIVLLRDLLIDSVVNLASGLILVVLMLTVMLLVDPVLTGISVAVMPLIVLLSATYGRRIRENANKQRSREGHLAAAMHEALGAVDVVQLNCAGERELARFQDLSRRSLKHGSKTVRLEARMNRGIELALTGGTVVVLFAGTLRALHRAITPGELVVFISYLRAAYRPLRRASKSVQRSAKALAAAERIVELLETEPDLADAPWARRAPALNGQVAFEQVEFAYPGGPPVLEQISFEVSSGATVAIVGESGSGKSTLVSLVPRLFDPSNGRVTLDGVDLRDLTLESVRGQISVVRQESVLFGLSIAENIRYGKPEASDEEVRAAAHAAALDDFVSALPEGYDTVISERGASLSGGERQRVAIARALVRQSPILILDEPTTGLDPETREAVVAAIRQLTRSTTTLLITHDMEFARQAAQIIVLAHGRVAGIGSHAQLLASSPEFRRLVDSANRNNNVVALPVRTLGDETWSAKTAEAHAPEPPVAPPTLRLAPIAAESGTIEVARKTNERPHRVSHLLFLPHGDRYLLIERYACLPPVGTEFFLDEPTPSFYYVTKLSRSPFPHDERPCAYLEPCRRRSQTSEGAAPRRHTPSPAPVTGSPNPGFVGQARAGAVSERAL